MMNFEEDDCVMELPAPVCLETVMDWLDDAPDALPAVAAQAQVREVLAARFVSVGLLDAAEAVAAEEQQLWAALVPLMEAAVGAALLPEPVHC